MLNSELKRYAIRREGVFYAVIDKHLQVIVNRHCGLKTAIAELDRLNLADKTGMIRKALTFY